MIRDTGRTGWGPARRLAAVLGMMAASTAAVLPCDLCAIYSATDARGDSTGGSFLTVVEQFILFGTAQLDGSEVTSTRHEFLDESITHIVPGFNFTPHAGVNLNVPLVHRSFQRSDFRYSLSAPPVLETEREQEFGLGDVALIGRLTVLQIRKMKHGLVVNL